MPSLVYLARGTSEQLADHGTLASLIRGAADEPAELCVARLCGKEEADETGRIPDRDGGCGAVGRAEHAIQRFPASDKKRPPAASTAGTAIFAKARHPELVYRLRLMAADALSLINRTLWLVPRTTTCITPEIEYSLL